MESTQNLPGVAYDDLLQHSLKNEKNGKNFLKQLKNQMVIFSEMELKLGK